MVDSASLGPMVEDLEPVDEECQVPWRDPHGRHLDPRAVAWLENLPILWTAADDSGRRLLTEAIFEKVEVLGVQSVTIHPTPEADAHGWSEAFGSVPLLLNAGRAFPRV